jgi:chloride channel 3/4/5
VRHRDCTNVSGEIVQSTSYQGFPVVRSEDDRTIVGFVNKAELRYALGEYCLLSIQYWHRPLTECSDKATRTRHLAPNATCTFNALPGDTSDPNRISLPDIIIPGRHPGRSPNLDQGRPSAAEATEVDFGQYVDEVGIRSPGRSLG